MRNTVVTFFIQMEGETMETKKPTVLMFAGPNGSGKSTITSYVNCIGSYVNADDIMKLTHCEPLEAAVKATTLREEFVARHEDFTFETVLSTRRNIELLLKAKSEGYFIKCFYVLTKDPSINISRVKLRVLKGGHDVPPYKIVGRYYRALEIIPELVQICDVIHIYDNSEEEPIRIFKKKKTEYFLYNESQLWTHSEVEKLIGLKIE